jgi:hypothetical protein
MDIRHSAAEYLCPLIIEVADWPPWQLIILRIGQKTPYFTNIHSYNHYLPFKLLFVQ